MLWTNVGRTRIDGLERFVLNSYEDRHSIVAGLDWRGRQSVLGGCQATFDQQMGPGVAGGPRMRPMLHFLALEILFEVAKRKELLWGVKRMKLGFAASGGARGNLATQRCRDKHLRPALLDIVDWDMVDPWMLDLDITRELRKVHRELAAKLFDPGPFFPAEDLAMDVMRRLHEDYRVRWTFADEDAWATALRRNRAIQVPGADVRFRMHCIKPVLEFYGVGSPARRHDRRGYCISPWKMEHVLRGMRWTGGLDVRDIPWMQDRYLHRDRHARLIEERGE